MSQARAIVFPEPHKVKIEHYDLPAIQPDEILIETEYSGVSQGTEMWAFEGVRPELKFPTVPGYQSIGKVSQVGGNVRDFTPGQRVMAKSNRLPSSFPETWMGAHASHLITKEAIPVADECDPVGAAISALPAVSLRGLRMIDIGIGDTVVVIGRGLIGQASAQLARLRGARLREPGHSLQLSLPGPDPYPVCGWLFGKKLSGSEGNDVPAVVRIPLMNKTYFFESSVPSIASRPGIEP
jgi:3-hydroxyethyl bacteriochlorophyllide a dehydrogenase